MSCCFPTISLGMAAARPAASHMRSPVAALRRRSTEAGRHRCRGRTPPPTACTGAAPPGPAAKVCKPITNGASCSEAVSALLAAAQHRVDKGPLAECRCAGTRELAVSRLRALVAEHRSGAGVIVGCTPAGQHSVCSHCSRVWLQTHARSSAAAGTWAAVATPPPKARLAAAACAAASGPEAPPGTPPAGQRCLLSG